MIRKAVSAVMLMLLLTSILTLAFNLQPVNAATVPPTAHVAIQPDRVEDIWPGEAFTINITVENAYDTQMWDANITFNPNILEVVDASEGPFIKSGAPGGYTFFGWKAPEGEGWMYIAATYYILTDPGGGVNGNGTLANITFQVTGMGETPIHFEEEDTNLWYNSGTALERQPCTLHDGFARTSTYETRLHVRESPPGSWVPGVPEGGWVWLTVDVESPFEWDNTPDGIIGWVFSVHVDPDVLEVNNAYAATFGYFLFDFIDWNGYAGHKPLFLILEINSTTGDMIQVGENIAGWETLGVGAGGDSGTPGWYGEQFGLCRLRFKSKNETAYTRIDIYDAYWVLINASAPDGYSRIPFDVVDDAHYNEPPVHTLTVESTPIDGINFTIGATTYTTNSSVSLAEGPYTVNMPSVWTVGPDQYEFVEWEDASTNPVRVISLTSNMTITATYELYVLRPISIYTDKYGYSAGDTMYLGLDLANPLNNPITVCVAIWLERPVGPIKIILHAHAVTLPAGFTYSNPNFKSFILPSIPSGVYTWHAALLNPTTHATVAEDTAEWQFT